MLVTLGGSTQNCILMIVHIIPEVRALCLNSSAAPKYKVSKSFIYIFQVQESDQDEMGALSSAGRS